MSICLTYKSNKTISHFGICCTVWITFSLYEVIMMENVLNIYLFFAKNI